MIKYYPVKVMYLKDYHEESKEETEFAQFNPITQTVPKPEIPVIFTNLFVKIYPNVPIEFEATRKDFFTFDLRNMFVFEPKWILSWFIVFILKNAIIHLCKQVNVINQSL